MDKLREILASDDLNVAKEELAFDAAMLWLNQFEHFHEGFDEVSSYCVSIDKDHGEWITYRLCSWTSK